MAKRSSRQKQRRRLVDHPLAGLIPKGASTFDEIFDPKSFFGVESCLSNNEEVTAREIADAIESNPGRPMPELMRRRICQLLRGAFKQKAGPKPSALRDIRIALASAVYSAELKKLQSAKTPGAPRLRAGFAFHEKAAMRAIKEAGLKMSVARFLNLRSEERAKRADK